LKGWIERRGGASKSERQSPREVGLKALLRRPAVRGLLVLTAMGQALAVNLSGRAPEGEAPSAAAARETIDGSAVAAAWEAKALERQSQALAARYRAAGYSVPERLASLIHSAAVENGIEPEVAFGLIRAESSFRTTATSPVGAVGLTQLMPKTAAWLAPGVSRAQLRDPATNIRIGFGYLRQLIDKYEGDVDLALVAYNRGPGTVDRALKQGRNPDNGYSAFVRGEKDHGHELYTR
jgi:soluble lytic murein transglycosylase-like protein